MRFSVSRPWCTYIQLFLLSNASAVKIIFYHEFGKIIIDLIAPFSSMEGNIISNTNITIKVNIQNFL